jgi:Spy/CpxP family protein refolding chaperone
MKIFLTAIALTIAAPALAQTAAPADAHAGHPTKSMPAEHQKHDGCCDKMADGKMMPCCEKMKAAGKTMDCCDEQAEGKTAADPHAGHGMSSE